jgi:hypothetical protein
LNFPSLNEVRSFPDYQITSLDCSVPVETKALSRAKYNEKNNASQTTNIDKSARWQGARDGTALASLAPKEYIFAQSSSHPKEL